RRADSWRISCRLWSSFCSSAAMRSDSATAAWAMGECPRLAISRAPSHDRPRLARECVVVSMDLLPLCAFQLRRLAGRDQRTALVEIQDARVVHHVLVVPPDRKSTRLNSSHLGISYAV